MTEQRTAVVTGAAGGLGAATVRHLAARGWRVYAADLDGPALHALTGERVVPVGADVTDRAGVEALRERVLTDTDGIAAVVTFAGVLEVGPLVELDEAALRRVLDVNVVGTFLTVQALFPLLLTGRGRVVLLSSETGWQTAMPFNGPYAMSKHAVEAYGDALRRELMFVGVPVVKVQPGAFRTGMVGSILDRFEQAAQRSQHFERVLRKGMVRLPQEQQRAADPGQLAELIGRVLDASRPRPAYRIHTNRQTAALSLLPARTADRLLRAAFGR